MPARTAADGRLPEVSVGGVSFMVQTHEQGHPYSGQHPLWAVRGALQYQPGSCQQNPGANDAQAAQDRNWEPGESKAWPEQLVC